MTRFYPISPKSFTRALLVAVIAIGGCVLAGEVLSEILNVAYFTSNYSNFWRTAFQLFSLYRYYIGFFVCVISVALCSGWIFAPMLDSLSILISHSLQFSEEAAEEIRFPKGLKKLEDELNSANKELRLWKYAVREAEQRKDDLVVYLAHDIRTPLTSVLGYLELLSDQPGLPREEREKFTGIALRKARRMEALVEELFEITRFNVGRIELERREVNPSILLNQLTEELAPVLESRWITVSIDNRGVERLFVDPDKMARVIDNILVNAAHYTPDGGQIQVTLDWTAQKQVRIRISNTGADIPKEQLDRFFEKFYRADQSRHSGTGGSGLGLAIAKNIVEAHGGAISAENKNRVTTFTIVLN